VKGQHAKLLGTQKRGRKGSIGIKLHGTLITRKREGVPEGSTVGRRINKERTKRKKDKEIKKVG